MSVTSLSIRFDIDTLECVDGIPQILSLADRECVKLTFYANFGKTVSLKSSLHAFVTGREKASKVHIYKLPSYRKQSSLNLFRTVALNPKLANFKSQSWRILAESAHEVGLHGGRNHAVWQRNANFWDLPRIQDELDWGCDLFESLFGRSPEGFASPGWVSPASLSQVLLNNGFVYCADRNQAGRPAFSPQGESIALINTNILGEPGHVGFLEHCYVKGLSEADMLTEFDRLLLEGEHNVMYDHPGFTSLLGLDYLRAVIEHAKTEGIAIKPVCAALHD